MVPMQVGNKGNVYKAVPVGVNGRPISPQWTNASTEQRVGNNSRSIHLDKDSSMADPRYGQLAIYPAILYSQTPFRLKCGVARLRHKITAVPGPNDVLRGVLLEELWPSVAKFGVSWVAAAFNVGLGSVAR